MSIDTITYYDFASLNYSAFYLDGLTRRQQALRYRLQISRKAPELLREAVLAREWLGLRSAMAVFGAQIGGHTLTFCIDTHDSNRLDLTGRQFGYHLPLLQAVDWYFKVNHSAARIVEDTVLAGYASKIVPIIPFFTLRPPSRWRYAGRLVPERGAGWTVKDARRRLRALRAPDLDGILKQRATRADLDLVLVTSFRTGARHGEATAQRRQLIEALRGLNCQASLLGFASNTAIPGAENLRIPRLSFTQYVRQIARARIVVYTRGLHDCLSSKLSLALALGPSVVGQPVVNQPELFGSAPHMGRQLAYESVEGIVARVAELLAKPDEVANLSRQNQEFFDRQLVPVRAAEIVLGTLRGEFLG